jgi:phosphopantothenoylcysteine decarboxylase/phosphopantothenate--cysteine ligase
MGFALAERAAARGADVTLIAGTISAPLPARASIRVMRVTTAAEMHTAALGEIESATIFIAAAAVADYRPAAVASEKIKKTGETLTLTLEPTADILAEVSHERRHKDLIVVGFAAESHNLIEHAREKLIRKKLDLIVANDITLAGAGFDSETNIVTLINSITHTPHALPMLSKHEAAERILDENHASSRGACGKRCAS